MNTFIIEKKAILLTNIFKKKLRVKKLVLILMTFILIILAKKEAIKNAGNAGVIIQVLCIQYSIIFLEKSMLPILILDSKVNTIYLTFTKKLKFSITLTNVRAQKIDSTM